MAAAASALRRGYGPHGRTLLSRVRGGDGELGKNTTPRFRHALIGDAMTPISEQPRSFSAGRASAPSHNARQATLSGTDRSCGSEARVPHDRDLADLQRRFQTRDSQ
jgi:hypothetical protein